MSDSPGIILTCQYTLPNQKSFGDYLEYMTREEALENKPDRTLDEEIELQEIKSKIYNFEFFNSPQAAHNETVIPKKETEIELEADGILRHSVNLEQLEEQDFTAYISYMARQYALEKKVDLTPAEMIEKEKISESLQKLNKDNSYKKTSEFLPGVFSCSSDQVNASDLKEIKKVFRKGQDHGSVIYQDVISHDNSYLEKLGLYDPKTEKLDEIGIKRAGREMMKKLFEKEKLNDTGFWMASIHRNTQHIHIHFAVVESKNTRPIVTEKINGQEITMPKGKRKQATLDEMKTAYAQELNRYSFELGQQRQIDRRALLTRKSDLRNLLVKEVKEPRRYDQEALKLLNEVYQGLPEKKSEWNYGTERRTKLSPEVRSKLDQLTEHILTSDVRYEEYNSISEQLRKEAKETFGESKQTKKDAQSNALFDLKKRTGNSILTSLKQQDKQMLELIQEAKNLNYAKTEEPTRTTLNQLGTKEPEKSKISIAPSEDASETLSDQAVNLKEGISEKTNSFSDKPAQAILDQLGNKEPEKSANSFATDKADGVNLSNKNYERHVGTSDKVRSSYQTIGYTKQPDYIDYKRRRLTRRSLRQVANTIEAHEEKYQAQRAYEIQQRRIQFEQERR